MPEGSAPCLERELCMGWVFEVHIRLADNGNSFLRQVITLGHIASRTCYCANLVFRLHRSRPQ